MHMRRSSGLPENWARAVSRVLTLFALVGTFVLNGGASTVAAAAAQLRLATAQTTATQLVEEYLSGLGLAGNRLSTVEATLKELGPSATRAQVLAAVAPLGPALAPIEALLTVPPPTTLEALPKPVTNSGDASIRSTLDGAHLDVGGKLYLDGFQINFLGFANYIWQLHGRYTTLSAQVGMDARYSGKGGVTVSFDDSTNTAIPFTYQGKLVFRAIIPTTGLVSLSVNVAHESEVDLWLAGGVPRLSNGAVDVVNDRLT